MDVKRILLRDNLYDTGSLPSWGSACASPDIIVHKEFADISALVASYNYDLNESVDMSSRANLIYTRVKNMSTESARGRISVFRSHMSLFMKPGLWKNDPLKSPEFEDGPVPYATFTAEAGKVAAADYPLVIDGRKPNFCLVGIISENEPSIPSDFRNYDEFYLWVHSHRNVAVRNLYTINSRLLNDYEGVYLFSNPENREVPCFVNVVYENLPAGTSVEVKSDYLRVNDTRVVNDISNKYGIATYVGANGNGVVKLRANASGGAVWTETSIIRVEVLVGRTVNDAAYFFGVTPDTVRTDDLEMLDFINDGKMRLVSVGSCGIRIFKG